MYLTVTQKHELFKYLVNNYLNTGCSESKIAIFTYRIKHLTEHMKSNKSDLNSLKSLRQIVSKRKKILNYLKNNKIDIYISIINKLVLKK